MAKEQLTNTRTEALKLSDARPVRLYATDDERIKKLKEDTEHDFHLDITDLIRDSVRIGLPILEKKLHAAKG
jgi:hypothetical protein